MTIGKVQALTASRKGAPQLKIDGKYYFVGKCNVDGIQQGDTVDFVANTFGNNNSLNGLVSCKPVRPQGGPAASVASAPAMDGDLLRYASNVVANAIQAGLIKEPKDVTPWYWAAINSTKAVDDEEDGPPPFDDIADGHF